MCGLKLREGMRFGEVILFDFMSRRREIGTIVNPAIATVT